MTKETAAFLLHVLSVQHLDPTAPDFADVAAKCVTAAQELRTILDAAED